MKPREINTVEKEERCSLLFHSKMGLQFKIISGGGCFLPCDKIKGYISWAEGQHPVPLGTSISFPMPTFYCSLIIN